MKGKLFLIVSLFMVIVLMLSFVGCKKATPTPASMVTATVAPTATPVKTATLPPAATATPTPTATAAPTATAVIGKPLAFNWAQYTPVGHQATVSCEEAIKAIETRSNGRIKVNWFPAEQLLKAKELFNGVATGQVQMVGTAMPYTEGDIPLVQVPGLFGIWKSYDHMRAGMEPMREALQGEYAKKGVYLTAITPYGVFYAPFSNKSIPYTPADLKGLIIRVSGKAWAPFVEACGASPTYLTAPELYIALQRGTVDGHIFVSGSFYDYKYQEVTKYGLRVGLSVPFFTVLANLSWWQALSEGDRKIIQDAATEIAFKKQMEAWFASEDTKWAQIKKDLKGVADATKEQAAAWNTVGEAVTQKVAAGLGPEAQKLLDLIKKYER